MKLTRHNGRSGKHGTYNPRHNDRRFDVENSEHIDAERARQNVYWDSQGHDFQENPEYRISALKLNGCITTSIMSTHDFRKTQSAALPWMDFKLQKEIELWDVTLLLSVNFYGERYGEALHLDEGLRPSTGKKALEELGIPLPKPEQPKGKHNNRKQTFDAVCRTILFDIAKRHGLHLEQEPSYGGRDYLEKQDYILMKQKEQLATQEQKLEELTLKIEDVETLLEDVSGAAYDKAVEVVTDKVREQTQLEDMEVIEKYRKSVVSPNAKNSPEVVKIANTLLSRVREKLQQSAEKVLKKVQAVLLKPEVKQAGKEQIKNKARKSIKEKLAQGKLDADRENRERWEREGRIAPTRKQDMEL